MAKQAGQVARRTRWTEQTKAYAYVVWKANNENTYKTAKDTGVTESTLRSWIKLWKDNGPPGTDEGTPIDEETIQNYVKSYETDLVQVRDMALEQLRRVIPMATEKQLAALVGAVQTLDSQHRLLSGLATERKETVAQLPSPDDMNDYLLGMIAAQKKRQESLDTVLDVEVVREQAPALTEGE